MKIRKFLTAILVSTFALVFISCGKDEEEVTYSAEKEQALLKKYLDYLVEEKYDIDTTANGVYYVVIEEGIGNTPQSGDNVSVSYNGLFIGGSVFDSSGDPDSYGYYTYMHRVTDMIEGWEEGIETIKEGGTSLLIVPSNLAYGEYGYYDIPPYTTLLFEIYVHDITSAEE